MGPCESTGQAGSTKMEVRTGVPAEMALLISSHRCQGHLHRLAKMAMATARPTENSQRLVNICGSLPTDYVTTAHYHNHLRPFRFETFTGTDRDTYPTLYNYAAFNAELPEAGKCNFKFRMIEWKEAHPPKGRKKSGTQ
ncbi:hypothetical protein M514_15649 [Trichuris suis]|uniref:Uncharacterized protein n=1 Tax=Trichuris suis TaxID=68888 RepID=A0A085NSD0_9BILA|nr:hypothetical protein M514_15649 [Trichuris suis]